MQPRDRAEIEFDLANETILERNSDERTKQKKEFFQRHEANLFALAKKWQWGTPGFELKEWDIYLLPDGFECPEEETYAELLNALRYWQGRE